MAEQLMECAICHTLYRISFKTCPRCHAENYARKAFHGGFYAREDVLANPDYITHNEHYNAEHVLTIKAFVPMTVPCNCRKRYLGPSCPVEPTRTGEAASTRARRSLCYNCMVCDREEGQPLDIDMSSGKIRMVS